MSWTPTVTLLEREPPLPAVGIVATRDAVPGLTAATRRRIEAGAELRAAAGEEWLVVLGATQDLPWADGCVYLGRDGPLLLPTTRAVQPPADLVAAALEGPDNGLLVVLDDVILRGPLPVRTAAL